MFYKSVSPVIERKLVLVCQRKNGNTGQYLGDAAPNEFIVSRDRVLLRSISVTTRNIDVQFTVFRCKCNGNATIVLRSDFIFKKKCEMQIIQANFTEKNSSIGM